MVRLPTSFSFHASSSPPDISNEILPPPQVIPKPSFSLFVSPRFYNFTDSNRSRCFRYHIHPGPLIDSPSLDLESLMKYRTDQSLNQSPTIILIRGNDRQFLFSYVTRGAWNRMQKHHGHLNGNAINRAENVRDS